MLADYLQKKLLMLRQTDAKILLKKNVYFLSAFSYMDMCLLSVQALSYYIKRCHDSEVEHVYNVGLQCIFTLLKEVIIAVSLNVTMITAHSFKFDSATSGSKWYTIERLQMCSMLNFLEAQLTSTAKADKWDEKNNHQN